MAEVVLETERLLLRKPMESDAETEFRVLNSPTLMERLGGPRTLDQIHEKYARSIASFNSDGLGFLLMIERDSGELVGNCGIGRITTAESLSRGELEIGWRVREDRWRRGYASEAVEAVMDWAFRTHGAGRLIGQTSDSNEPSWRLMEKLGMDRRRELDYVDPAYPPEDNPTIIYVLTREQWEKQQ